MTIDLPSAGAGFGIASIVLGWLATYVFATKADLAKHDREDRDRSDRTVQRLFDKVDGIARELAELRVDVATKYSRSQQAPQHPQGRP